MPTNAGASSNRKQTLKDVAQETVEAIPQILTLTGAPDTGYICLPDRYTPLSSRFFPDLRAQVQVINGDSFDVAVNLHNAQTTNNGHTKPVCVLNLASESTRGGGFLSGAMAQEEALCYRSTLYKTLKKQFYPLRMREAIYSPVVVIFRENYNNNYRMMDLIQPQLLPIVSVVSVAAIRRPKLDDRTNPSTYADPEDRQWMKEKMRVTLRVCVHNKHRDLVLGALGCGAFGNPPHEVADCWVEVLEEQEFRGWFSNIVFAVMSGRSLQGYDNFQVFHSKLHGLRV
ncbi:uncharacterized protein BJX67DRAFT_329083 [Aspergillus lucknowensis]|uniref:Microbial-type PARG catalytic domain-containing protein n=1 Tax=Aspergillus lucknowensis TaxID=176173 RepID=A0ABR4L887_9EURO